MEGWQKFSVSTFGAARIRIEQVALLQRIRNQPESALPSAVQKVQGSVDSSPMLEMKKSVGDGLGIASLQNVLRWLENKERAF